MSVSWTALKIEDFKFPAYFVPNDILPDIVDNLQRLGMRIIRTSTKLQESVSLSDREAEALSKKSVISFLRSHNDACKDKCQIGGINRPVEETCFQDMKSVCTLADYCLQITGKDDEESFDEIPLLVTNDGLLRQLTVSQAVFLTPYCNLLPSLGKLFVSNCLVSTFPSDLLKQGLCKEFLVEDFLELYPHSVEQNMLGTNIIIEWNSESKHIPNDLWIQTMWKFIWDDTIEREQNFKHFLKALGELNFVPSTAGRLHPISELYTLIQTNTFEYGSRMRRAVEKLKLPELQKNCLPRDHELLKQLNKYAASSYQPKQLLRCFCFHTNRIKAAGFSSEESSGILRYFANNLTVLKKKCDWGWIKSLLKVCDCIQHNRTP